MPFASVIAATDLTELSAEVPARARQLAQSPGARVVLAHVAAEGRKRPPELETQLEALASETGADAVRILGGEAGGALAALATTEEAGLIVLGLHRKRRVLDVLRLTTMERIVLTAPCPVLIAQSPAARPYQTVLLATDFSPASAAALISAARVAPLARFHAIHALVVPIGRDAGAAMTRAEEARAAFLATPGLPDLAGPPEIVEGGVHAVLAYRLEELQPDLLCLAARSASDSRILNPYARDLMRAPPCDVLVAMAG